MSKTLTLVEQPIAVDNVDKKIEDLIEKKVEERFKKFEENLEALFGGVHEHLDEHLDSAVADVIMELQDGFKDLRERIAVVEKLERIEKRVDRVEVASQRYKV